jgi:hypothetical protein
VLHVAVQLVGENDAVTPEGTPEAEKETEGAAPDVSVAVIELVIALPATTDTFVGLADSVNEVAGELIVNETVAVAEEPPPVPVTTTL